jgi:quinol monooxygenase YgiN
MRMTRPFWAAAALCALAAAVLPGCAISTPFPRWQAGALPPDQPVVLVVSRVVVDPARRAEFDRQTRRVIDQMAAQPGLIGYSARRELFGSQAWTVSAWESEAHRAAFMRSAVHRQAIDQGMEGVVSVELKRLTVPRSALPANWPETLDRLAQAGDLRSYWE